MQRSRLCCFYSHARERIRFLSFIPLRLTGGNCRQNAEVSSCLHLKFASVRLQSCDHPKCETNSISHQAQLDEAILFVKLTETGRTWLPTSLRWISLTFCLFCFLKVNIFQPSVEVCVVVFMSWTFRNSRKSCHFHFFMTLQTPPRVNHLILTNYSALWLQWWSVNATYF